MSRRPRDTRYRADVLVKKAHRRVTAGLRARLSQAALAALAHEGVPPRSSLTIVLSDDSHLQALDRQFADLDAPTDVLSFPTDGEGDALPEGAGRLYLGDVIISLERAEAQARAGGHSLLAELQLLTVHGTLHLVGHDHAEPEEKSRMWHAQAEVLAALGADIAAPRD